MVPGVLGIRDELVVQQGRFDVAMRAPVRFCLVGSAARASQ
jgi:hypothetical protein